MCRATEGKRERGGPRKRTAEEVISGGESGSERSEDSEGAFGESLEEEDMFSRYGEGGG